MHRWRGLSSLIERVRPVLKPSDFVGPRGTHGNAFGGKMAAFACSSCGEQVADAGALWICHACGEYRSPKCAARPKQSCSACGAKDADLNQPTATKAERGASLVKDGKKSISVSRLAVHCVAQDAQKAFLEGNKTGSAALHEYALRCYNWIGCAAPEHFHAGGFDGQLLRSVAMRAHLSGDAGDARRLVAEAPELFVNQEVLPIEAEAEAAQQPERSGKAGRADSLFLDLAAAEPSSPRAEAGWRRVGEVEVKRMGAVTAAWDRWKSDASRVGNFRWVFPDNVSAARFLTSQYREFSEDLPMVRAALSVGSDCVVYGGQTKVGPAGESVLVIIYCFREENAVAKVGLSRPMRTGASAASAAIGFNGALVAAFHHAAAVQRLLEGHPAVKPRLGLWTRLFGK